MATATASETFALGDWVVVGPNTTRTPEGIAKVTLITENGSLIVASGHMQDKHLVAAACCTRHPGPPPGRELVPLASTAPLPTAPPAPVVTPVARHEPVAPAPEPERKPALTWRVGDRVRLTRDHDGLPAGTEGAIFGRSAVEGYHQVKTSAGVVVVIGEDLEAAVPQGMQRGEREAAERAKHPPDEPTRLQRARLERRKEEAEMSPPDGQDKLRGPRSEDAKQAVRDGVARKKAERKAAAAALANVTVETMVEQDGAPAAPARPLRLVAAEPPATLEPASAAPPERHRFGAQPVEDALRFAIAAGAEQRLSVAALRRMLDTLEAVEQEVRG